MELKKILYKELALRKGLRITFSLGESLLLLTEIAREIILGNMTEIKKDIKNFRSTDYLSLKKVLNDLLIEESVLNKEKLFYFMFSSFRQLAKLTPGQCNKLKPLVEKLLSNIVALADEGEYQRIALFTSMFSETTETINFKNNRDQELFFDKLEQIIAYFETVLSID